MPCSCKRREREGVPCSCFFKISDDAKVSSENIVDLDQIDPRYWKVYNSHYGDDSEMGQLMHQAQQRSFDTEGLGVMITDKTAHALTGAQSAPYPILGKNTTMEDFLEAKFVMGSQCPCTVLDLEQWRAFVDLDDCESDNELHPDNTPLSMLDTYSFFSQRAEKMKEAIQQAALDSDVPSGRLSTNDERQVMYNDIMRKLSHVQDDCRISEQQMRELKSGFESLVEDMYKVAISNEQSSDNSDDGGSGIEYYGEPDCHATQPKRKRRAT